MKKCKYVALTYSELIMMLHSSQFILIDHRRKTIMTAYKRFNIEDRNAILNGIENHCSFSSIAKSLKRAPSSIAREVLNHRVEIDSYGWGGSRNRCLMVRECDKKCICACSSVRCKNKNCAHCRKVLCNNLCPDFIEEKCAKLSKPPYVCNGCKDKGKCNLKKMIYKPVDAQTQADTLRSESRSGMCFSEEELKELNDIPMSLS